MSADSLVAGPSFWLDNYRLTLSAVNRSPSVWVLGKPFPVSVIYSSSGVNCTYPRADIPQAALTALPRAMLHPV